MMHIANRAASSMPCYAGPCPTALARVGQHPDAQEQPICVRPLVSPRFRTYSIRSRMSNVCDSK